MRHRTILLTWSLLLVSGLSAFAQQGYQKPSKAILDVLNAPTTPNVSFSPSREKMLLEATEAHPTIADLSEPMLRIAGLRINPNTNGLHRTQRITGLTLRNVTDGKETKLALPANARIGIGGGGRGGQFGGGGRGGWSADSKHFAFTNTTPTGIELWIGDGATGAVKRVPNVMLNAAYGEAVQWMPDNQTLLCQTIVAGRGKPPAEAKVPTGPNVQESFGRHSPAPTYEDLLKNPHDEDLFEYYATSQLVLVNIANSRVTPVGKPAIIASSEASPDGKHLLVISNHKP
ncbi:MAG: S9 family peptidase, partial [Blastocatellia bacterium]